MPEAFIDLLTGTLHSNYTALSGTVSLDVVSGVMPDPGDTWSIRLNNGAFYTVTGFSGSGPYTATLSALEYATDVNCTTGQPWSAVTSKRAFAALISQSAPKDLISPESRAAAGGTMNPFGQPSKGIAVTSGSTQTVLDISSGGPGYLPDFWLAIADLPSGHSGDIVLKLTVDGTVIYNTYHALFFCTPYWADGDQPVFANDYLQYWGGHSLRIPIPFNTSLKIEIKNNYSGTIHLWWTGGFVTGVANDWHRCQKLIVVGNIITGLTQDAVATLIDVSSLPTRGRLLGLAVSWDGGSASNNAFMEGEFKITLDGTLAYQSSGSEDLFGMAGFFAGVSPGAGNRFQTLTLKVGSPLRYGAMRFFIGEPMNFENALKIELAAGMSSTGFTFSGTLSLLCTIWYYVEN